MKERDPLFDVVKFFVMLLVVSGHLTGNNIVVPNEGPSYLDNINVGVAMPIFFIISGYFAQKSYAREWGMIISRIICLLWPLISFGCFFGIILYLSGMVSISGAIIYPLKRLIWGSWFLPTLAIIYGMCGIIEKTLKSLSWKILTLCCIYILLFFFAGQGKWAALFHLGNVLDMMPYFVVGWLLINKYELYRNTYIGLLCGFIFLLFVFTEGDVRTNGMGFYWVPKNFQSVVADTRLMVCFWGRTIVGIVGSVFILWLFDVLIKRFKVLKGLACFGTTTLGVYVMHEWPMNMINHYCSVKPLDSVWKYPVGIAVFLVFHYLTLLSRRNRKVGLALFGDEKAFFCFGRKMKVW